MEPALEDPDAPEPPAAAANAPAANAPAADVPAAAAPGAPPDGTPLISVLTPVHDPPLHMLHEAIASVHAQTLTNWELCLIDDGSRDPAVIAALQHHADADPRIQLIRHDTPLGISAATNAGLAIAHGAYIATLDHDDTLTPDALATVAARITAEPDLDMLYSDEDVVGEAGLIARHPKPGWSPEHMAALMYTCHLGVYRRELATELGGFQTRYDGCQDYDFVLRLIDRTPRVAHIPRILYHWRAHATSTAGGDQAKPYAYLAQPGAIAEHLQRRRIDARVHFSQFPGLHRIVHDVGAQTSVDLVLALTGTEGLAEAAAGWLSQPHPSWRVVLAAPATILTDATAILTTAGIDPDRVTTIATEPDQDPATALTAAAAAATADHLLLMQAPAVGLTHDWLTRLLGYSNQPGIAAAGPILLAPDGRIHHAGIAIPDGIPLHLHHGSPATAAPPVVYNLSAVSGMLATSRATYDATGGLHPHHRELTLIDYCLRATTTDQRTVIVPDARLRTTGPDPTLNDLPALRHLRHTWTTTHTTDPYYNPNYRTDRGDYIQRRYD